MGCLLMSFCLFGIEGCVCEWWRMQLLGQKIRWRLGISFGRKKGKKGNGLFPRPPPSVTQTGYNHDSPNCSRTRLWYRGGR